MQDYFLHAYSLARKALLFQNGKRSENVFFDHVDDQIEMGDDDSRHAILIIQVVVEFLQVSLSIIFFFDLFGVILEIEVVGAELQFL